MTTPSTSTKQIGKYTFTFAQLAAWDNFRAFYAFLRLLGPAGPHVVKVFTEVAKNKATATDALRPAAIGLLGTLPQVLASTPFEELQALAQLLMKNVVVENTDAAGKKHVGPVLAVFDTLFQGQLLTMMELFTWCIQEAFGGFFAEAMMKWGGKEQAAPSPKVTP